MGLAEAYITTADGLRLFVRDYRPEPPVPIDCPTDAPRKTLVIIHGAMEHGGRYEHVVEAGLARGWRVIVPDLRGHGRSEGVRCHVDRFSQYLDDLALLFGSFQLVPAKTALLGHSLGGLITIRFAQTNPTRLARLAATAPLLGVAVPIPPLTLFLGRGLSRIAPRTRFHDRVTPEMVTRSPESRARRAVDPLIIKSVTARWYMEALAAISQAHKAASSFALPALVLQGAADCVTDVSAAKAWTVLAGASDVTFQLLPEQLHELLQEPERDTTIQTIFDWLEPRVPE